MKVKTRHSEILKRRATAEVNIAAAQKKQKKRYDAKHSVTNTFKVGQKVLKGNFFRTTRMGAKNQDLWLGSFLISKVVGSGTFKLKILEGVEQKRAINGANLKLFVEREVINID